MVRVGFIGIAAGQRIALSLKHLQAPASGEACAEKACAEKGLR
jgi:hypothetical protein